MEIIWNKLKCNSNRESTRQNYLTIWSGFNKFVIKLDKKPALWEDRICLYCAFLVDSGVQSSTLKSYYSAIKAILREDGYTVNDDKVLLTSLARACRLINDKVRTRLPIRKQLLEMILFEIERKYSEKQPYLEILYKTILIIAYYGLFRIGELCTGNHQVKAIDCHVGQNKQKILFILYTSKTHGWESRPQKIKISALDNINTGFFCPFNLARKYFALRGSYADENEPFFVFRDKKSISPSQIREVLYNALYALNLNPKLYGFHSLRVGRCTDLIFYGKNIQAVKTTGRWKSNAVYKYIRM